MTRMLHQLFEVPDTPTSVPVGKKARTWRDYQWGSFWSFVLIHVGALGAFWTGASAEVWIVCFALFFLRLWGVTAGYHRYFSHKTYKTSRVMQFLLAFLAQTSSQKGALWWAAHHRNHHKYSDTDRDVHSPVKFGFWHSHVMWLYDHTAQTDYRKVKDLAKYPELVALNKLWALPPTLLGIAVWAIWGWSGLFVGFMFSTVLLWHSTFTINSLSHIFGKRRYDTTDHSRNNWALALLTLGEGWHNNHHHYMASCRQGFFWWEVDMTYYVLKAMSWVGLVWDIREPPRKVYELAAANAEAERRAA